MSRKESLLLQVKWHVSYKENTLCTKYCIWHCPVKFSASDKRILSKTKQLYEANCSESSDHFAYLGVLVFLRNAIHQRQWLWRKHSNNMIMESTFCFVLLPTNKNKNAANKIMKLTHPHTDYFYIVIICHHYFNSNNITLFLQSTRTCISLSCCDTILCNICNVYINHRLWVKNLFT